METTKSSYKVQKHEIHKIVTYSELSPINLDDFDTKYKNDKAKAILEHLSSIKPGITFLYGRTIERWKRTKQNKTSIQWTPGSQIYLSNEKIIFGQKAFWTKNT